MTDSDFIRLLEQNAQDFQRAISRTIPLKVGNEAVRFVHENFRRSGFLSSGLKKWKPSKRIGNAKGANGSRKTLFGSGNLFNSTHKVVSDAEVRIINDCPYAAVHNDGLHAGRGAGFTMPQRQFIGDLPELNDIY